MSLKIEIEKENQTSQSFLPGAGKQLCPCLPADGEQLAICANELILKPMRTVSTLRTPAPAPSVSV